MRILNLLLLSKFSLKQQANQSFKLLTPLVSWLYKEIEIAEKNETSQTNCILKLNAETNLRHKGQTSQQVKPVA